MSQKFFLYARKSTDVEDKQVLSIDAQLTELRAFAREQSLEIVEEFIEKQSAKVPGRPIFGQMLKRIEKCEVSDIVSWHPDRLARNSVDGGQIVYLLDTGKLASLKFPIHWFENTPQGKFSLSMAFVQSKYYVDSLSENTKRGLRQKVRMGIFPSQAPVGYLNDPRTKTIVVERKKARVLRLAFERYVKGNQRLEDIADFLAKKRGQPERKPQNEPQPFCGLISCASCGMMITGEYKVKKQKNGNVHNYTYYHCTKKSKTTKCPEPCIRQEELDKQLSALIKSVSLTACVKETEARISAISQKLERLLDGYLEQDIEREVYRAEKAKLLSEKKSLEEEIYNLSHKQNNWLEPMKEWIKDAQNLDKIASDCDLFAKKVAAKEIFGSNLLLQNKTVCACALKSVSKSGETAWSALCAAHASVGQKPLSQILVPGAGIEPARQCNSARDFKSLVSTNFTTPAYGVSIRYKISSFDSPNDSLCSLEARMGEKARGAFARPCQTVCDRR